MARSRSIVSTNVDAISTKRDMQALFVEKMASRVRELATARRFKAASLGNEVGVSSSAASLYWNGKRPWPTEVIPKLALALGTTVDYLFGRTDDPSVVEFHGSATDFDALVEASRGRSGDNDLAEQLGLRLIPEVDIAYSMGGGAFNDEHVESRLVPFRRDWLERISRGQPADFFLAGGIGDSMMPTILDGDDVLVNRAEQAIRHQDRIWAVGYGELGMIKRVRRLPSGLFQLNSDNPAVTPIEATEDELFIVGRVAWIGRRV